MALRTFSSFIESTATKKDIVLDRASTQMQYPSGFMYLDYAAGNYVIVCDDDEVAKAVYHNIGIVGGTFNMVLSKSQGGKTSLCIKLGVAHIEPFINAILQQRFLFERNPKLKKKADDMALPFVHILDSEKTLGPDYVKKLSQYKNSMMKNLIEINPVTAQKDVMAAVDWHCRYKEQNMEKIFMPMNDMYDQPILSYPPTVLIIDSLTQVQMDGSESTDAKEFEKQTNNMAGAQRAKMITALVSRLTIIAKKYNITIYSINHINKATQTSIYPQPKQYRGLRQDEIINGGERALYLAANILRLDVTHAVGTKTASMVNLGEGVTGFVANAKWIKCKSNSKGAESSLVYTNEYGYDPLLSNLYEAKQRGDLPKSGNFYYLPNLPSIKFTLKNARETFRDNPQMIPVLYDHMTSWCEPLLDNLDSALEHDRKSSLKLLQGDLKDDLDMGLITTQEANELEAIYNDIYCA